MVESQTVDLVVAGSSPVIHPYHRLRGAPLADSSGKGEEAPVAQLDRVPDFESVGRRFESCRA